MELKFKIFLFVWFAAISIAAQNITVVDSVSGKPIPDVIITSGASDLVSNSNGVFSLDKFNNADTLTFKHLSYLEKRIPVNALKNSYKIILSPKQITTSQVYIEGKAPLNSTSEMSETIELDNSSKARYSNPAEVLKYHTTLTVKDYGGDIGMKTVSSRGMSSENTVILFNEARVNDLRTGSFDFSMLDVFLIDKIEYIKNNGSNGYLSSGGTVKIFSGNLKNESSTTIGAMFNSNQTQNYFASIKSAKNSFSYSVNFSRSFSPNKYNYNFEGQSLERSNAHYSKTFVSGDIKWSADDLVIKFYTHYSHLLNGLPGFVVTNNYNSSKASTLTNAFLNIANLHYLLSKKWFFNSTLSYHNQFLQMNDPENQLLVDRNSQSSAFQDLSALNKFTYKGDVSEYTLGYDFNYAHVDSLSAYISGLYNSNNAKRVEHNFSASGNYLVKALGFNRMIFSVGLNYQVINENILSVNNYNYLSYRIGAVFTHPYLPATDFTFSYSDNYRHPTFNERYYSSLYGNTDLKGEKYRSFNAGLNTKYELLGKGEIELTYFSIWGDNKIIWTPTRLALQIPSNIKNVRSQGIEFSITQPFWKKLFDIEFMYTFTDVRNRSAVSPDDNSYNKQLIYTPKHKWNLNGILNISDFSLSMNTTFVSERFYTSDNNPRNSLPHYFLMDISLSYKFNINNFENRITINAYNILDEDYFIIQSYPMPLKTLSINYQVRFL
ncbi:MAG: TonB-dependent receptor [Chlorobi bacterium]|nr:TonB-dependent receptor [Chlorobiota bacterium]